MNLNWSTTMLLKRVPCVEQAWQRIAEAPSSVRHEGLSRGQWLKKKEEWLAEEVRKARVLS